MADEFYTDGSGNGVSKSDGRVIHRDVWAAMTRHAAARKGLRSLFESDPNRAAVPEISSWQEQDAAGEDPGEGDPALGPADRAKRIDEATASIPKTPEELNSRARRLPDSMASGFGAAATRAYLKARAAIPENRVYTRTMFKPSDFAKEFLDQFRAHGQPPDPDVEANFNRWAQDFEDFETGGSKGTGRYAALSEDQKSEMAARRALEDDSLPPSERAALESAVADMRRRRLSKETHESLPWLAKAGQTTWAATDKFVRGRTFGLGNMLLDAAGDAVSGGRWSKDKGLLSQDFEENAGAFAKGVAGAAGVYGLTKNPVLNKFPAGPVGQAVGFGAAGAVQSTLDRLVGQYKGLDTSGATAKAQWETPSDRVRREALEYGSSVTDPDQRAAVVDRYVKEHATSALLDVTGQTLSGAAQGAALGLVAPLSQAGAAAALRFLPRNAPAWVGGLFERAVHSNITFLGQHLAAPAMFAKPGGGAGLDWAPVHLATPDGWRDIAGTAITATVIGLLGGKSITPNSARGGATAEWLKGKSPEDVRRFLEANNDPSMVQIANAVAADTLKRLSGEAGKKSIGDVFARTADALKGSFEAMAADRGAAEKDIEDLAKATAKDATRQSPAAAPGAEKPTPEAAAPVADAGKKSPVSTVRELVKKAVAEKAAEKEARAKARKEATPKQRAKEDAANATPADVTGTTEAGEAVTGRSVGPTETKSGEPALLVETPTGEKVTVPAETVRPADHLTSQPAPDTTADRAAEGTATPAEARDSKAAKAARSADKEADAMRRKRNEESGVTDDRKWADLTADEKSEWREKRDEERARGAAKAAAAPSEDGYIREEKDPAKFLAALKKNAEESGHGAFVYIPSIEELSDGRKMYVGAGGETYAVKPDGDIVAVSKGKSAPPGWVKRAIPHAVTNGGTKMDNFDRPTGKSAGLPDFYAEHGFRAVARMKFDPQYQPPGWDAAKHGTPDVVFMARDKAAKSYSPGDGQYVDSYDKGVAAQAEQIARDSGATHTVDGQPFETRSGALEAAKVTGAEVTDAKTGAKTQTVFKGIGGRKMGFHQHRFEGELLDAMSKVDSKLPFDPRAQAVAVLLTDAKMRALAALRGEAVDDVYSRLHAEYMVASDFAKYLAEHGDPKSWDPNALAEWVGRHLDEFITGTGKSDRTLPDGTVMPVDGVKHPITGVTRRGRDVGKYEMTTDDLVELATHGVSGRWFYRDSRSGLVVVVKPDDVKDFMGLSAPLSNGESPESQARQSVPLFLWFKAQKAKGLDNQQIAELWKSNNSRVGVDGGRSWTGGLDTFHLDGVRVATMRAQVYEYLSTGDIKSPKVGAYFANLTGDESRPVIDRHMLRVAGRSAAGTLGVKAHREYSARHAEAADILNSSLRPGQEPWTPAQVQAAAWRAVKWRSFLQERIETAARRLHDAGVSWGKIEAAVKRGDWIAVGDYANERADAKQFDQPTRERVSASIRTIKEAWEAKRRAPPDTFTGATNAGSTDLGSSIIDAAREAKVSLPELAERFLLEGGGSTKAPTAMVSFSNPAARRPDGARIGDALVSLLDGAGMSSVNHEMAHVVEYYLPPKYRATVLAYFGKRPDEELSRNEREIFARLWEKWDVSGGPGGAGPSMLRPAFEAAKDWAVSTLARVEPDLQRRLDVLEVATGAKPKGRLIEGLWEAAKGADSTGHIDVATRGGPLKPGKTLGVAESDVAKRSELTKDMIEHTADPGTVSAGADPIVEPEARKALKSKKPAVAAAAEASTAKARGKKANQSLLDADLAEKPDDAPLTSEEWREAEKSGVFIRHFPSTPETPESVVTEAGTFTVVRSGTGVTLKPAGAGDIPDGVVPHTVEGISPAEPSPLLDTLGRIDRIIRTGKASPFRLWSAGVEKVFDAAEWALANPKNGFGAWVRSRFTELDHSPETTAIMNRAQGARAAFYHEYFKPVADLAEKLGYDGSDAAKSKALGEALFNGTDLPGEAAAITKRLREAADHLGQRMVEEGVMTQETLERHKGKYFPLLNWGGLDVKKTSKIIKALRAKRDRGTITAQERSELADLTERFNRAVAAQKSPNLIRNEGEMGRNMIDSREVIGAAGRSRMRRTDTWEEAVNKGLGTDNTLADMMEGLRQEMKATTRLALFREVRDFGLTNTDHRGAETGKLVLPPTDDAREIDGYTLVRGRKVGAGEMTSFGALEGHYVKDSLWSQLEVYAQHPSEWSRAWDILHNWAKQGKTVFRAGGHLVQRIGNPIIWMLHGVPMTRLSGIVRDGRKLVNSGVLPGATVRVNGRSIPLTRSFLERSGVLGHNILDPNEATYDGSVNRQRERGVDTFVESLVGAADRLVPLPERYRLAAKEMYGRPDEYSRAGLYVYFTRHGGMSHEEAVNKVRQAYDVSHVPPTIRTMGRALSFFRFQYLMMRNAKTMLKETPWVAAKIGVVLGGLRLAHRLLLGYDDDQYEKALWAAFPGDSIGARLKRLTAIPFIPEIGGAGRKAGWFSIWNMMPQQSMLQYVPGLNESPAEEKTGSTAAKWAGWVLGSQNVITKPMLEVATDSDLWSGQGDLMKREGANVESPLSMIGHQAKHVAGAWLPSMTTDALATADAAGLIPDALSSKRPNADGGFRTPVDEAANAIAGTSVRRPIEGLAETVRKRQVLEGDDAAFFTSDGKYQPRSDASKSDAKRVRAEDEDFRSATRAAAARRAIAWVKEGSVDRAVQEIRSRSRWRQMLKDVGDRRAELEAIKDSVYTRLKKDE